MPADADAAMAGAAMPDPRKERARPESVIGILRAAEHYLRERRIDAPRRSAELLMARLLGMSRLELYLAHDRPLTEPERATLRRLVAERGRGVPLAHLLGDWDFLGLCLRVDASVLIPRSETEHLAELAIASAPRGARCLDLGTGSGAIAIALGVQRRDVTVVATDVSPAAAAVARENVTRHGVEERVRVVEGSYWEPLRDEAPFDVLVSNPPYVDPDRADLLAPDVRAFEPHVALFTAPGDPVSAYRAILRGVPTGLQRGALLLMETGVGAAEPALALLRAAPFLTEVELRPDLAGLPRYLIARTAP